LAQEGDNESFAFLYKKYFFQLITVFAKKMVKQQEVAEDLVQNAFIKAFLKIRTFDSTRKFSSWIYRIVRNECITYMRRMYKYSFCSLDSCLELQDKEDIQNDYLRELDRDALLEALARIKEKYRKVLFLYFIEEKSYKDIELELGINRGTVGTYIFRGKRTCLDELKKLNLTK
jgi:RNA polymerase sigma-70 factor, ECF subfamily